MEYLSTLKEQQGGFNFEFTKRLFQKIWPLKNM